MKSWLVVVASLFLILATAGSANAEEKGGPYTVFSATVRIVVGSAPAVSDVPTLVRFDPKTGKTWVMVPPAAAGSAPYWIPVVDPIDLSSTRIR